MKLSADLRGYWRTTIYCRNREVQILFKNGLGAVRIIRRPTELDDFLAAGIVRHEDSVVVMEISEEIIDDVESTNMYKFWKQGTVRNVSKSDMMIRFSRSCQDLGDGRTVCLVDMTVSTVTEKDMFPMRDAYKSDKSEERYQLLKKLHILFLKASLALKRLPEAPKQIANSASIPDAALPHMQTDFEKMTVDARRKYEKRVKQNEDYTALYERTMKLHRRASEMRLMYEEKDRQQSSVAEEKPPPSNLDQSK